MRSIAAVFFLAMCLAGCDKDARGSRLTESSAAPKPRWAILYYGMGDNSLAEEIVADVREMAVEGPELVVAGQIDVDDAVTDVGDRRFFVKSSKVVAGIPTGASFENPVQEFDEIDSGSSDALRDFLLWARASVPADHFVLVMSGHGYGYSSKVRGETVGIESSGARYFSFDLSPKSDVVRNSGKSILTTTELARVLDEFRRPDGSPWIEVLVADSCVSQTFENAYALKNVTSFYVASQEAERASGHDWGRTLGALRSESGRIDPLTRKPMPLEASGVATAFVRGYASQNLNNSQLSAIDVAQLEPLHEALQSLIAEARPRAERVEEWLASQAKFFGGTLAPRIWTDLWRLASEWEWAGVVSASSAAKVREALDEAVVSHKAVGRGSVGNAYGLSITFPAKIKVRDPARERASDEWEIQVELGTAESEVTRGGIADLLNFIHCRHELGCDFGSQAVRYDVQTAQMVPVL